MQNTGGGEVRRIFVRVFGFSDAERHALNTVFRLSESRTLAYAPWSEDAPEKARVALIDGDSWEAAVELANPRNDGLKLVWVGQRPPVHANLVFSRPLRWSAVLEGMDGLYPAASAVVAGPAAFQLDFDISAPVPLDIDFDAIADPQASDADTTTEPAPLDVAQQPEGNRVLVVEADRDARLYIRAKLANAGLLLIDEAVTAAEAQAFMSAHAYVLAMVNTDMGDMDGWALLKEATHHLVAGGHVAVMCARPSLLDRWRASRAGALMTLAVPLRPMDLKQLLSVVRRPVRR